jgi:hypothetical protein
VGLPGVDACHRAGSISFVVVTALLANMPCFAFDEDVRRLGVTVVAAPD